MVFRLGEHFVKAEASTSRDSHQLLARAFGDREEYSPINWLLDEMLDRAGFTIREALHYKSRIYSAYTCMKR
jgi:hypothetical protein